MLPSGNDAAFALAQHFGRIIMNLKKEASQISQSDVENFDESTATSENTETKLKINQIDSNHPVLAPVTFEK